MRRVIASLIALLMLLATSAATVTAAPPSTALVPFFGISLSTDNTSVAFWNITRADYCAWEASGFDGEPPVIELVPIQQHVTGKGAIVMSYMATRPLELWTVDADADLSGPCTDTDGSDEPWAIGTATQRGNDNDLDVTLTRTNSFGGHTHGTVWDATGQAWSYVEMFRAQITQDDEFFLRVYRFSLRPG